MHKKVEVKRKSHEAKISQNGAKKINYAESGVDYTALDPAKKLALAAAKSTAIHLQNNDVPEITDTRGETAFVWQQGDTLMAAVNESLGTKNLVADAMRKITNKTYYDIIGHDTVASTINDLISVGAMPLVVHAFWAVGESSWFDDKERIEDLVSGWKEGCDEARATWGGGETPSYNDIVFPRAIALGASAVGIIKSQKNLITDKKLTAGDRIILIKSSGINCNGISLARSIAKELPDGYGTKLKDGTVFGEAILNKTNIYATLIQDLQKAGIDIHYISNITGHGMKKIMRARGEFTYVIENIIKPQEVFLFIQKHANLDNFEMYQTYNMGMDYAIFLKEADVKSAQEIIKQNNFESIDAGYVETGPRQVIIKPKNLTYKGETLDLR